MELSELTVENVTPVIAAVVNDYGRDYTYPYGEDCMYQVSDKPACIVGHVLDRLGVEYNPDWERNDVCTIAPKAPVDVLFALDAAQTVQDRGESWGKAYDSYVVSLEYAR